MIIYSNECLSCFKKDRLREVKNFAQKNKLGFEERRIAYNREWQEEYKPYIEGTDISLPFIVNDGIVIAFDGELDDLLKKGYSDDAEDKTTKA